MNLSLQFVKEFLTFKRLAKGNRRGLSVFWRDRYPCLNDKTEITHFDRHYVYHLAWAARVLAQNKPRIHIDIASSLYFGSILSAFIPMKFYDYRPADLRLSNFSSESADLCALDFPDESIESISCMPVIEHIGLGRYGDPLDPDGDLKGIRELKRVLGRNGSLLFVVPVGKPKIMFNAHRIYSYEQVLECFQQLHLEEFVLIPESPKDGGLIYNATDQNVENQNYACGCFWFKKK